MYIYGIYFAVSMRHEKSTGYDFGRSPQAVDLARFSCVDHSTNAPQLHAALQTVGAIDEANARP